MRNRIITGSDLFVYESRAPVSLFSKPHMYTLQTHFFRSAFPAKMSCFPLMQNNLIGHLRAWAGYRVSAVFSWYDVRLLAVSEHMSELYFSVTYSIGTLSNDKDEENENTMIRSYV